MVLVDAATVIIGSPTVLTGAHPAVIYGAYLANLIRPKARFATVVGSYGWKGKLVDQIVSLLPNLEVELLEPVVIKKKPSEEAFQQVDRLINDIVAKYGGSGLLP
ncbi:MAG: hypothetical protein ACFFD4_33975 [Candidatus Odinarchaeota archaeon]